MTLLQMPVQQSPSFPHASPGCVQYEDGWQTPFVQSFEQQSSHAPHLLPSVLQELLSG
jgi:hypothetical protein